MNRTLLLATIATTMFAFNVNAMDIKPYVEGKISQNWVKAELSEPDYSEDYKDNIFGGSLEIGSKINQFRVGFEGYYNEKLKDHVVDIIPIEFETKGVFLNAYYDLPLTAEFKKFKPYIGAGVGYSWLKGTMDATRWGLDKGSSKDDDISWNVGLGVAYEINNNVDITLGYRYEDLGKIKDDSTTVDITNHKVFLGLRYNF